MGILQKVIGFAKNTTFSPLGLGLKVGLTPKNANEGEDELTAQRHEQYLAEKFRADEDRDGIPDVLDNDIPEMSYPEDDLSINDNNEEFNQEDNVSAAVHDQEEESEPEVTVENELPDVNYQDEDANNYNGEELNQQDEVSAAVHEQERVEEFSSNASENDGGSTWDDGGSTWDDGGSTWDDGGSTWDDGGSTWDDGVDLTDFLS